MTPVRNEAWILNAFLKATSLWADFIIIADQCSTDGSREIAMRYPKVILIDNNNTDYNEAVRQKMLIDKAREIDGDKILFALDADEIFAANFNGTSDWEKILNSKKGDVFWFRWAQVLDDKKHYWIPKNYFPWVFHDDGLEPHGNYASNIHSMRIPYPIEEKQNYYIEDFFVLHFQHFFPERNKSKQRFYTFVDYSLNKRSIVKLNRTYSPRKNKDRLQILKSNMLYLKDIHDFNLFEIIDTKKSKFWFDLYIVERIKQNGLNHYNKIDIWNRDFLKEYNYSDPRSVLVKLLHFYLRCTQNFSHFLFIRGVDKILKKMGL
jgi:hypothetical protein